MHKGRRLGLLPFFFSLSLFLFSQPKEIIYKGFILQNPAILLKSTNPGDITALKTTLEESGFFREVSINEDEKAIIVRVKEYPRIIRVKITGNTLYKTAELLAFLKIKRDRQFNARKFQSGLQHFYQKSKQDGYTHYTLEQIKVHDHGLVEILINEGILRQVTVENELINQRIIARFFKGLLGRPFNSHKTKYILEELLFTEAFHKIDSEVRRKNGQVYLHIRVDKKRIKRMRNSLEYSSFGGFKLTNLTGLVKRNNRIHFTETRTEYFTQNGSKLVHFGLENYGYGKHLQKNMFSLKMNFFYTSYSDVTDLFLKIQPSYTLYFFKNISLLFFISGGINKNLSDKPNALIAETGLDLSYSYRSPLDRTKLELRMEYTTSLLENYTNFRLIAGLFMRFPHGELKLYSQKNFFWGDIFGFNYNLIPLDQIGILQAEDIFSRDSLLISGQLNSNYLWGWFKVGILAQYYYDRQSKVIYGLNTFANIKSIPLNLILFWLDSKPRIMARVILSF